MTRPVDILYPDGPPNGAMSRPAALQTKSCARCGDAVDVADYFPPAVKEYEMTGLCLACQDEVYASMMEAEA